MQIETGLFDHMVLQRNKRNVSEAAMTGTCDARGPVTVTVRKGKAAVKGFAGATVGAAARGRFAGCLKGLPVGGPYSVELKVGTETLTVKDVLVGDVWLLGGQSNMQGCGLFPKRRLPVDPQVRAFYMDDRWAVAEDPVHNMWACVDQVHIDLNGGARPGKPDDQWGVCPGPAFGNEMRRLTRVPQGLIASAHGGTSMTQWDPARKHEGGKSLYGAMARRLKKNGGRVAGLVWYQGCSDADGNAAPRYTQRMKALIAAIRRDSGDKALPVTLVQIARVIGWGAENAVHWNSIQEQQRRLPTIVRQAATVPAIDLPLDDGIHIGGAGQYVLGMRLARAMHVLREGRKAGRPPLALKKISVETARGLGVVVVEFDNVVGKLCSGSRPSGFAMVSSSGVSYPFDIQLDGSRALVRTGGTADALTTAMIHYGYGTDPYCNIMDEAGRVVPVFGPVRIGVPRAITPFVRQLRVSAFQPSAGKLHELECPAGLDAFQMAPRVFADNFCNLHPEIQQHGGRDELVYFACRFACQEEMPLALLLGYDGPVKAWMDGQLLVHDPAGVNPATPEKSLVRFQAGAGTHEIVVALGTNSGAAWGIFLRIERLGLTKRQLLAGPTEYRMPEMLG
jgi:sialate O-acetylesterase